MQFIRKHPKFFKFLSATVVSTSVGWVYYQVRTTRRILNCSLDTSVLMEPLHKEERNSKNLKDVVEIECSRNNIFLQIWDSLKFSYVKRLISLTNSDDKNIRLKAINKLTKLKNLDDWHCSLLANMINARTAVALARSMHVDNRLFLKPHARYITYSKDNLLKEMKHLLMSLHHKSQHPCMGYFITKVFIDHHDRLVEYDATTVELSKLIQSGEIFPMCLESLLHHSSLEDYAKDIVDLNGLPLLMEIHNRYKNNIKITVILSKIMSNLSFFPELLEPIFKSGWISVLADWVKEEDINISGPATKALANLDSDDAAKYTRHIYLLHPPWRQSKLDVDVVFVHGLLGGVFFTWRQRNKDQNALGLIGKASNEESISQEEITFKKNKRKKFPISSDPITMQYIQDFQEHLRDEGICDEYEFVWDDIPTNTNPNAEGPYTCPGSRYDGKEDDDYYTYCWPKDWLAKDLQNLRIIGINYDTNLSMWAPICSVEKRKATLDERSNDILSRLLEAGLGSKPIIWVTHSMGGLIVKNILCKAFESENEVTKNISLNTKGIVFYSTPHIGSRIANLTQATALVLWPSVEVQELRENSPQLVKIHEKFLEMLKEVPMKIVTFVETKSTAVTAMKFNFLFVEPHSGNPGVGEYYEVPQDHLGICKPVNRYSFLYQKVLNLVKEILDENRDKN